MMRRSRTVLLILMLWGTMSHGLRAETASLIGEHYGSVLNGLTFVRPEQAGFMVRVGWVNADGSYSNQKVWTNKGILRHGVSAPDYSINDIEWQVGEANVRMMWSKTSPESAACLITADKPVRVTLEATPAWQTYVSTYSLKGKNVIAGKGQFAHPPIGESAVWYDWTLKATGDPVAKICVSDQAWLSELVAEGTSKEHKEGRHAALVYDLDGSTPLAFVAGFGSLSDLNNVKTILNNAFKEYEMERVRAFGDWGKFLDPMINQLGHCRLYDFQTHWVAPAVCRYWRSDDGVMYFVWDSFFNAQMYCLEDFEQAKIQLRALFLAQQENGLLPLYSGARWDPSWDRSQPPVGSMCVWKIYQRWPDKAFLEEFYPKLKKWHDWWFAVRPANKLPYRDGNQNGLLEWGSEIAGEWQHAVWESGLDDSPMYDNALMKGNYLALDDVGLNGLFSMDALFLAKIAEELGYSRDAERFRKENREINQKMNELLWNEEKGIYCNRYWSVKDRQDYMFGDPIDARFYHTVEGKPGVQAEYYLDQHFQERVLTRIESEINYHTGPDTSSFTNWRQRYWGRWTGTLTPEHTGDYTFTIASHGPVRLWLGDRMIIDAWDENDQHVAVSEPVALEKAKPLTFKLEHSRGWRDRIKLAWFRGPEPPAKSIFSDTLSPMCFYPMISGAPNDRQAASMMNILKAPDKFWGDWIMPTVARDDPSYPDEHYWRGKIWPPSNYLVYQGLKNYAGDDLREEFARKSINLFMRNYEKDYGCYENFENDGSGSSVPYYTWGALMCLIGLEEICDIEPDGSIRLNGALPEDVYLRDIPLFGRRYDIEVKDNTARILKKDVMFDRDETDAVKKDLLMEASGRIETGSFDIDVD